MALVVTRESQEEYSKYRESTSILIPMVGYKYIPLAVKRSDSFLEVLESCRTIFFEYKKYEYNPKTAGSKKE